MRKSIKSFIVVLIVIIGILQLSTSVFATTTIPTATQEFYVNDFAGVFTVDEKTRLIENAVALANESNGIQVVVTTVKSIEGDTIENYALKMYNQYGIGKDDMGILILLSTEDRQIRVEVGKSMEAYFNDSKAGRFMDKYAISFLKQNKFNEGLIALQEAVIKEINTSVESQNESTTITSSNKISNIDAENIIGFILFFYIAGILMALIVYSIRKIITKNKKRQNEINSLTKQLEISRKELKELSEEMNRRELELNKEIVKLKVNAKKDSYNYKCLEQEHNALCDRYERAKVLYPTVDNEITAMIDEEIKKKDMAEASRVDEIIKKVSVLSASKEIVFQLKEAISQYLSLSQKQKSYVKSDINRLNQLYDESSNLKKEYEKKVEEEKNKKLASEAVASIMSIISCISVGKARNLRDLKEAKSIYNNLGTGPRAYFDNNVLEKVNELLREAKRDEERRRRREEEERRRCMYENTSIFSSFGNNSHFGGYGGNSGGGGASRGF